MHWHDERSDNGLLCKSAVSWILTLLHSRNIGKPPPGMQCLCLVPWLSLQTNLHSYRGQTCLSRLTFMPGTNLLWDGPLNEGFWAKLRTSLAWDNQETTNSPYIRSAQIQTGASEKHGIKRYVTSLCSISHIIHFSYIIRSDKAFLWWWRILKMASPHRLRWDRLYQVDFQYAISLIHVCSQDQVRCWLFLYDIMSATRGGTNRESLCQFGIGYVSWNQHRVGVTQCGLRHSSLLSVLCKGILQLAAIRLIWQEFSVVADQEDFMLIHKK